MATPAVRRSKMIMIPKPQYPPISVGSWLFWAAFILFVVAWNVAAAWKLWQIACLVGDKLRGLIP